MFSNLFSSTIQHAALSTCIFFNEKGNGMLRHFWSIPFLAISSSKFRPFWLSDSTWKHINNAVILKAVSFYTLPSVGFLPPSWWGTRTQQPGGHPHWRSPHTPIAHSLWSETHQSELTSGWPVLKDIYFFIQVWVVWILISKSRKGVVSADWFSS